MSNPSPDVPSATEQAADGGPSAPNTAVHTAEAPGETLRGCLSLLPLLALWGACGVASPLVREFISPLAGLVAAVVTTALWFVFGPRPMPGFLQGTMAVGLLLTNIFHAAHCIYLLL